MRRLRRWWDENILWVLLAFVIALVLGWPTLMAVGR